MNSPVAKDASVFEHPHFLIFTTRSGAQYLFDAATLTAHPLFQPVSGEQCAALYEDCDDALRAAVAEENGVSALCAYMLKWRRTARAFGASHRGCPGRISGTTDDRERSCTQPLQWTPAPSTLSNLILVLTKDCNLRCDYCIYSGLYQGFSPLGKSFMSWETARKAIDIFLSLNDTDYFRSIPDRKLDISFYGGEPLLCSDMLEEVIRYACSRNDGRFKLHFSVTSNLTSLTKRAADFLVSNRIGINCSLDGPASEHDRYRRFPSGKGTFDAVWRNLELLRSLDEAYFNEQVRALVTINGNSDLEAILRFFDDPGQRAPQIAFVNILRDLATGDFHKFFPFDSRRYQQLHSSILDEYFTRKRNKIPVPEGSFLYHYVEESLIGVYSRIMKFGGGCQGHYTGTCQPGRRLTVSTDGAFHICERISEEFPIGSVHEGVNVERCNEVMRRYAASLPSCNNCWARGMCHLCFAHVGRDGGFRFPEEQCRFARAVVLDKLVTLYSLLEEVPDALSFGDPLVDRYRFLDVR
ncbi:MAG: radical SAM protein [Nitrospirota bacterium]